jgi:hypothetical protein
LSPDRDSGSKQARGDVGQVEREPDQEGRTILEEAGVLLEKVEGKGVVRFMDVTQHNGNSFNSVFTSMGGTGLAYADDFEGKCSICRKGASEHRVLETASSGMLCTEIITGLRRRFAAGLVTGAERKRWRKGFDRGPI